MENRNEVEIKKLISKIEVNEEVTIKNLEWLSKDKNHVLEDYSLTQIVRYLLLKVNELEEGINHLTPPENENSNDAT